METSKSLIKIQAIIETSVENVWKNWTTPEDIIKWNSASDDWHTTKAENDLTVGGKFTSRMEAKDGSMGFDFYGVYDKLIINELIEYTLGDNRKVKISFTSENNKTIIDIEFEAESTNPVEMQRDGWQAILNNFKKYSEVN
jgi:uncharacterized protein YndB with AHSA1/START domain